MSPFVSGVLGAVTFLLLAGLVRRVLWRGRSFFLHRVFRRLGTRPEQEQVVMTEADALAAEIRDLRGDAFALREELAELVAGPSLDATAVVRALQVRLARLDAIRPLVAEALARVHSVLEPPQRQELAALLRHGPSGLRRRPHHC